MVSLDVVIFELRVEEYIDCLLKNIFKISNELFNEKFLL